MKTEIIVITDRSGSMSSIQKDVIGGFNKFLEEQKAVPGECRMTYTQFDSEYEVVYQGKTLSEAPLLDAKTFVPRGMTALNDAIGRTLNEQGKRIAEEKWAELVIVQIITDGGENCSREYFAPQVKTMIEHAQANGWKILFLAANQDAFLTGGQYGISAGTTMNYTANSLGSAAAYASTSAYTTSVRGGQLNATL